MGPSIVQVVSSAVGTAHLSATAIKVPASAVVTRSLPAASVAVRPAEISVCVNAQQASVPAAHLSLDTLETDTAATAAQTTSAERTSKKWFAAKQTSFTDAKLFVEKWEIEAQSAMSSRVASASSQSLSVAAELSDGSTAGLLHDAWVASHKVSILSTSSWIRTSAGRYVWFLWVCTQYSLQGLRLYSLGLLLGTEAHVITSKGTDSSFLFLLFLQGHVQPGQKSVCLLLLLCFDVKTWCRLGVPVRGLASG